MILSFNYLTLRKHLLKDAFIVPYVFIAIMPYGIMVLLMLRAKIDKRLEQRFREIAMKRFGYTKGALSRAMEEAILVWLSAVEKEEEIEFEGDPVDAIDGLLSDVDMDSVQLQHKAKEMWMQKVVKDVSR